MKVKCEYDTVSKVLKASMDDQEVSDVSHVEFGRRSGSGSEAKHYASVTTSKHNTDHSCDHMTHMVACDSFEGKAIANDHLESKTFPGFYEVAGKTQAQIDIAKFLGV